MRCLQIWSPPLPPFPPFQCSSRNLSLGSLQPPDHFKAWQIEWNILSCPHCPVLAPIHIQSSGFADLDRENFPWLAEPGEGLKLPAQSWGLSLVSG